MSIFDKIETIINETLHPQVEWRNVESQKDDVVKLRHFAFWLLYYYTNETLFNIGFYFGKRTSGTVSNVIADVNDLVMSDIDTAEKIKLLMAAMERDGFEMINKEGRKNYAKMNVGLAFHGIFKTKKNHVFLGYDGYVKVVKPQIEPLDVNFLVDPNAIETHINTHFPQQKLKRANDFYSGVIMAESHILPSYKQLLDFYNNTPKEFYVAK